MKTFLLSAVVSAWLIAAGLTASHLVTLDAGELWTNDDDPPKKDKRGKAEKGQKSPPLPGVFRFPPRITLSADQQTQVDEVVEEYLPAVRKLDAAKKRVFTREQEDARKAAREKAHADGLRGREAKEIVDAAITLSDEQKARLEQLENLKKPLDAEIREKLSRILTDEQKARLGGKYREKKGPPKGEKGKKPEKGPPPTEKGRP